MGLCSIAIPYVKGLSETLKCILAEVNVHVIYQPHITLRPALVHVKDLVPEKAIDSCTMSLLFTTGDQTEVYYMQNYWILLASSSQLLILQSVTTNSLIRWTCQSFQKGVVISV